MRSAITSVGMLVVARTVWGMTDADDPGPDRGVEVGVAAGLDLPDQICQR